MKGNGGAKLAVRGKGLEGKREGFLSNGITRAFVNAVGNVLKASRVLIFYANAHMMVTRAWNGLFWNGIQWKCSMTEMLSVQTR